MKKKGREWYRVERAIDIVIVKRKKRYERNIRFYIFLSKIDRFNRKKGRISTLNTIKNSRRHFLKSKGYI